MRLRVVLLLCAVLFLNGCSSTEILYSHKEEGNTQKLNKVFVFGALKEPAFRKIFEQKLVAELKRNGLDALTPYDIFPDKEQIEESEARAAIKKYGLMV